MSTSQCLHKLVAVLANTEHYTGLGYPYTLLLRVLQYGQSLTERRATVSNEWCQRLHSLNIMGIDIKARLCNQSDVIQIASKISS